HRAAIAVAERPRKTIHLLSAARVPRLRHRAQCGTADDLEMLYGVLHEFALGPVSRQGLTSGRDRSALSTRRRSCPFAKWADSISGTSGRGRGATSVRRRYGYALCCKRVGARINGSRAVSSDWTFVALPLDKPASSQGHVTLMSRLIRVQLEPRACEA